MTKTGPPGKPSKPREIFTGDEVQFGSLVTQIQPVIATIIIADQEGVLFSKRYIFIFIIICF